MNIRKKILTILIALLILFVPIPKHLNDEGTTEYKSLTYKISSVHRILSSTDFEKGIIINLLGFEIYNDVTLYTIQY